MRITTLHSPWFVACALVVVGGAGCGRPGGLDVHPVSGKVTLDGQPIEDGLITFRALEGDTRGFAGPIKGGEYKVATFARPMTVAITAYREVPGKFSQAAPDMPKVPVTEQYVPARYNDQSELQADIPSGGNRQLDFSLSSD